MTDSFKERYRNHTQSFQDEKYTNGTVKARMGAEKKQPKIYNQMVHILKRAAAYTSGAKRCNLRFVASYTDEL